MHDLAQPSSQHYTIWPLLSWVKSAVGVKERTLIKEWPIIIGLLVSRKERRKQKREEALGTDRRGKEETLGEGGNEMPSRSHSGSSTCHNIMIHNCHLNKI